jgi:hypothetical protein
MHVTSLQWALPGPYNVNPHSDRGSDVGGGTCIHALELIATKFLNGRIPIRCPANLVAARSGKTRNRTPRLTPTFGKLLI